MKGTFDMLEEYNKVVESLNYLARSASNAVCHASEIEDKVRMRRLQHDFEKMRYDLRIKYFEVEDAEIYLSLQGV